MKHALFNPIATTKECRISAIALAFVLLAMFGLSSGLAQVKNQKRVTSVRLGSASEGSRVTVVSDSALNDYEAYRRGDRFYVKIPAADFASAVPNFRGTGFEDVQVQKDADCAVISFGLQPGTTARVDQRANRLDVVFSTSQRQQNPGGNVGQPVASSGSSRDGRDSTYSSQNRNDRAAGETVSTPQQAVPGSQNAPSGSASQADVPASTSGPSATAAGSPSEATSTPEVLLSPTPQSRASDTSQPSATQTVPPLGGSVEQWVAQNWVVVLIAALLLASLVFLLVMYRRSKRKKTNQSKRAKQTLIRPKSALGLDESDFAVPVVQSAQPSATVAEDREPAGFSAEPVPSVPHSSEINRIQKKLETPPSKSVLHSQEAKPLIAETPLSNTTVPFERIDHEVTKLLAGEKYDTSLINAADAATRQMIAAQLLTALGERSLEHQEHARRAFMNHGYFDDATRDLRDADSPQERAAAASRLGTVRNSLATTHLIAALRDNAPEVRRSAVESLGQIGDPAALSALNDLLLRETRGEVLEGVIRHAIKSITVEASRTPENLAPRGPESHPPVFRAYEREAFHELMGSKETQATKITDVTSPPAPTTTPTPATVESDFAAEETRLRLQEEALIRAAEELERCRLDVEEVRKKAEEEAQLKAANEERAKANAEAQLRAEEDARRAEQEARQQAEEARLRAEEEARLRAEHQLRERSEEEARLRADEDGRFRLEAETLRRAAEELARRRAEAEATRRLVEEETQRRAEEERERVAEQTRRRAEEEAQRQVQEELRRRVEEEMRRRVEEEARRLAEEGARRRAEEERQQLEAEERRRVAEERLQMEQEALMQAAAELTRRRAEVMEEERRRAEEESRLLLQAQEQMRAAEEQRRLIEEERQRLEAEAQRRVEEERQRLEAARRRVEEEQKCFEEARLRAEEEQKRFEEQARLRAAEEEQRLAELDAARKQAEQSANQRAEQEQRIRAEIEQLQQAEQELHERIEAETHRRAELEARLRDEEARRQGEEETRLRVEQEVRQQAEEARLRAEEEVRLKAETEARLREEESRRYAEKVARLQAELEARHSAEEARLRAEEETSRRLEVEARLKEEEASRQAEEEARLQAERKAHRIAEEARLWAEQAQRARASESIPEEPDSQSSSVDLQWTRIPMEQEIADSFFVDESFDSSAIPDEPTASSQPVQEFVNRMTLVHEEKEVAQGADDSGIPSDIFKRLNSIDSHERATALSELALMGGDDAFSLISRAFDDESADVRNAAAHALYEMQSDRAVSFTHALREGSPERRRKIGAALATSGLADNAVNNLTGESREKTYDAFSLLFLMAKAGEVRPLMQAIEEHANVEVRLAVVKLLALSGQAEIVPAFRRLAVRGSLPSEVRAALMEAIYQISSQAQEGAHSVA